MLGPGALTYRAIRERMVTWEMPDGTEFRYLGAAVSDAALREFVLRFMSAEGMSWDSAAKAGELGFTKALAQEAARSGITVLVFQPVRATA